MDKYETEAQSVTETEHIEQTTRNPLASTVKLLETTMVTTSTRSITLTNLASLDTTPLRSTVLIESTPTSTEHSSEEEEVEEVVKQEIFTTSPLGYVSEGKHGI